MKRSSSALSRVLSLDSALAEFKTSPDAAPVSVAPRVTSTIFDVASRVPCATLGTLRGRREVLKRPRSVLPASRHPLCSICASPRRENQETRHHNDFRDKNPSCKVPGPCL